MTSIVGGCAEQESLDALATEWVDEVLAQLEPDQRDVLLLRVVAQLTIDEIAVALGKSSGAVKALQRRGLAAARRLLAATDEEFSRVAATPIAGSTVYRSMDWDPIRTSSAADLSLVVDHFDENGAVPSSCRARRSTPR